MSEKKLLSPENKAYAIKRSFKSSVDNIAQGLNIAKSTFYNNLKEDEDFAKMFYQSAAEKSDALDDVLYKKALDGDMVALRYYTHNNKISCYKELEDANLDKNDQVAIRNFITKLYINRASTKKEIEKAIELLNKNIEVDNKLSLLEHSNIDEIHHYLRNKSNNELSGLKNHIDDEIKTLEKQIDEDDN